MLPVWHEGQWQLVRWGNRRHESRFLPCTGWTKKQTLESGWWSQAKAQLVEIPAQIGYDSGVWYLVYQGLYGVLVWDEDEVARVFVVVEPASHYYQVMTRSQWMPTLIEQHI